jgi:hypothetical protein
MKLKEIINKSVYGTTGYIGSLDDLNKLQQYIVYNYPILKEFKQILVATNYNSEAVVELKFLTEERVWKKYFPDCICLSPAENRGHNFGTADLDNLVFDYCKANNEEWLCKSDNDVILDTSILNVDVSNADFYYLNGIGYGGMVKYNFDNNQIIDRDFYPQTWFYFIYVPKTDFINDKTYLNETFHVTKTPGYNGKIWEYIDGWSCENFLRQCVWRNHLTKWHITEESKYRELLEIIKLYQIHDCSHKNIMINGVCHFQYPEQPVLHI